MDPKLVKPLHFAGSSRKDLREMPEAVQKDFGKSLLDAQFGGHPPGARVFGEGLPREVMKLAEDHRGDTYRAAYTVAFPEAVYVLHIFKKKSASGVATPAPDRELIRSRLQWAEQDYRSRYG